MMMGVTETEHVTSVRFPRWRCVAGIALIAWVAGLGLDYWPLGRYTSLPRGVSLCIMICALIWTSVELLRWAASSGRKKNWGVVIVALMLLGAPTAWGIRKVVRWRATIWLADYLLEKRTPTEEGTVDVFFCFVDHFEPAGIWQTPESFPVSKRLDRIEAWEAGYREAITGHADSDGRCPQQTWMLPVGHMTDEELDHIAMWPRSAWGEIEYHLHHRPKADAERVHSQIQLDLSRLRARGACTHGYGFVHGCYALAAGDIVKCHIVDELDILQETGCYADFTFPNLYTSAQPSQINSIFYAKTTGKPKPHDRGIAAEVGKTTDGLLLVQGPMWAGFTVDVLDDGNLSIDQIPDPSRINHWMDAPVHVKGRPNWVFITVHSHSATEYAQQMLWRGNMQRVWDRLESRFKQPGYRLHYVTTREVYNVIKAAEAGKTGNPAMYRDFTVPPPKGRQAAPHTAVVPVGRRSTGIPKRRSM